MILFRRSASELMDPQADSQLLRRIRQTVLSVPGVLNVETLWVRKSGLEYFVDIHIEVDGKLTVAEGHRIGHDVKDVLLARYHQVRGEFDEAATLLETAVDLDPEDLATRLLYAHLLEDMGRAAASEALWWRSRM